MPAEPGTWGAVVGRVFAQNVLFSALVELTYRCNLDCFFCYNDVALRGTPMTTGEWLRFFSDLRDMQAMNLTLTGGEPLAHPDFFRLGRAAREMGFVVRVKSNGHALGPALARRLKDEVDPYSVDVSLHGATAATHDRQTRVPGSFEKLLANVRDMHALGLRLKVNSALTAWNEGEVEELFALADSLGVSIRIDPEVTPRDDGDRGPLAISASREGVKRLLTVERRRAAEAASREGRAAPEAAPREADEAIPIPGGKHCGAGSSGVAVDPFGNVYPCVAWRRSVGSLHERPIGEIWAGNEGLEEVRGITAAAKAMLASHGAAARRMAFCPGLAATASGGDPLRLYPGALRRAAIAGEVDAERPLLPVLPPE